MMRKVGLHRLCYLFKPWIPAFAGMTMLFTCTVFAGNKNVGTSGAQFLKLGAGARPVAMGEAFVGIADDANALYYNPAGAAQLDRAEFTATHTQWFQDMNYEYGGFVLPTKVGTLGISASTLKIEDLEKRTADESYVGQFETLDACYGLSYARKWNETLSWGGTLKYLKQEIDSTSAKAWSVDLGLWKQFAETPFSAGLAVRNLGEEVKFVDEGDPQPLILDGGVGGRFFDKRLLIGTNVKIPRDNDVQFGMGGELTFPMAGAVKPALRAGYNNSHSDADGASGVSLGAGLTIKQFSMDFSWVPLGDLGETFRYSANFRF